MLASADALDEVLDRVCLFHGAGDAPRLFRLVVSQLTFDPFTASLWRFFFLLTKGGDWPGRFPFYYEMKILFVLFLMLPQTQVALWWRVR